MIYNLGTIRIGTVSNNFKIRKKPAPEISTPQFYNATPFNAINRKIIIIKEKEIKLNKYRTLVELHHTDGGLKKVWYYNQDSDNPIQEIKIEVTKKGSGGGQIKFAYIDFPVLPGDYIIIMFQGRYIYKGFVTNYIDFSNPLLQLSPYTKILEENEFYATPPGSEAYEWTIQELLENIIINTTERTGIIWKSENIEIEDETKLTYIAQDKAPGKIIDELIEMLNNSYWGVDTNNNFYVRVDKLNTITKKLYQCEESIFKDVKVKIDYNKVVNEHIVYKKIDGESKSKRLGIVGTGGDYPELETSKSYRKITKKITVPAVVNDSTALKYAYAKLKNLAKPKRKIEIKNIDLEKYSPKIDDRIMIEDELKLSLLSVNNCNSIADWNNTVIDNQGIEKGYCIKLFYSGNTSYLDLEYSRLWYRQKKIGLYLKSKSGLITQIGFTNNLNSVNFQKMISKSDNWEYHDFNQASSFRYIVFYNASDIPTWIDQIMVLCDAKRQYIDNVSKIQYSFKFDGIECNITLGNTEDEESSEFFNMKKRIEKLEEMTEGE